ncbi:MAG: DegQ family serine endoprotease [Alphaproteobacteria bacterium]|nr:DegQ family serine endoprotease [Alphaproteobacteria bacterium]MDE2337130.1 DegQ family serine endoprotease [Alphaproteobacteria bacterium]
MTKETAFKKMRTVFACVLLAGFALPGAARAEMASQQVPVSIGQMQLTFAPLVKKVVPAVVNIYAKRVVRQQVGVAGPFFNDPFFGQFMTAPQFGGLTRDRVERSLGSGVIVGADGIIATNHHVIGGATEIRVVLSDGRAFDAKKILDDPRTDLAVLKIDTKGEKLPVLRLADSDNVEVGDLVLAVGDPFGVGQTVTNGIVSGLARTDVGISDYRYFIQTDAAINPGNSGGALVDMEGRLIGINSEIYSKDGGSLGIGFAVPANMVKAVVADALNGGKVARAWTGMIGQPVTRDMLQSLHLKNTYGSLTAVVVKGGPADRAGIRRGDVILAINGKQVQDPEALKFRLGTVPIGSAIALEISRAGKIINVTMPAEPAPAVPPADKTLVGGHNPFAGAEVANISPALLQEMGQLGAASGVVVYQVQGGTAAIIGLRKGDVIANVNGTDVVSVTQLKALLARAKTTEWQVRILRGGQAISLNISG